MKSLFVSALLFLSYILSGQSDQAMSILKLSDMSISSTSIIELNVDKRTEESPFITLALKTQKQSLHKLQYRYSNENDWSAWTYLKNDLHNTNPNKDISSLIFLPNTARTIELKLNNYIPHSEDEIHLFFPKRSISNLPTVRNSEIFGDCPCPQPSFKGRDQWCQNGNCPTDNTPIFTEVSHLIVHHTAGSNTSSDWSSVVYSIWNYHVNTNGWDDIGYNWLIDPNGVVYEGRADNIQGAHFCGKNGNTMGICILGTYTDVEPQAASMKTLKRLFAWKACQEDIDPKGISYHPQSDEELYVVSGHRDGCATACPGDMLYALIPNLRDSIVNEIITSCGNILPPIQLSASIGSPGKIDLNWTDQSDNETTFVIERKDQNDAYFYPIASTSTDISTFEDDIPLNAEILDYRVLAANQQDTSIYSNVAQIVLPSSSSERYTIEGIKVFPSLFKDYVHIQNTNKETINLRILDTSGKTIYEANDRSDHSTIVPTNYWKSGVYFVHIRTAESESSIKIIKTNE